MCDFRDSRTGRLSHKQTDMLLTILCCCTGCGVIIDLSAVKHCCVYLCVLNISCSDAHLRLTHEQLRICNYNMSPGEVIKIVAFAGMLLFIFTSQNLQPMNAREITLNLCLQCYDAVGWAAGRASVL